MILNRSVLLHCLACLFFCVSCSDKDTDPPLPEPEPPIPVEGKDFAAGWSVKKVSDNVAWDIQFVDANTGFFVGDGISKTTDAGKTWIHQKSPQFKGKILDYCSFIDGSNGWATSKDTNAVFKTTDGGQTVIGYPIEGGRALAQIKFINSQIGFVAAGTGLYKTTDGGISWVKIYNEPGNSLFVLDENTLWMGHPNGISGTKDGSNFYKVSMGFNFLAIQFFNKMDGLVLSQGGGMFQTNDGGVTWKSKLNLGLTGQANDFHFFDLNNGYATDISGIKKITDNKVTTELKVNGSFPCEMFFTDRDHGYVCSMKGFVYQYTAPK